MRSRTTDRFADWERYMASRARDTPLSALAGFFAAGLPGGDTPISDVALLALDIETTGLDPSRDAIVSIGLVPFDSRRIRLAERRYWLVHPGGALSSRSVTLHRITHADIENAPEFRAILPELLDCMAGRIAVVHYRAIERSFLDAAVSRCLNESFAFPTIDTMEIEARRHRFGLWSRWRRWLGHSPVSIRLHDSRARYHLPHYQAHHALVDALATAELFQAQLATHFRPDTPLSRLLPIAPPTRMGPPQPPDRLHRRPEPTGAMRAIASAERTRLSAEPGQWTGSSRNLHPWARPIHGLEGTITAAVVDKGLNMFKKILVPVDLAHKDAIEPALTAASDLARHHGAEVCYIGVTATTPGSVARTPEEYQQKLDAFAQEQSDQHHGQTVSARAITSPDPVADLDDVLLQAIEDTGADLVVMATHLPTPSRRGNTVARRRDRRPTPTFRYSSSGRQPASAEGDRSGPKKTQTYCSQWT
ncbi:MAG: 3'-5' exonuclease [Halofilum sp. (in: g-proteobacteria)]|nr:3'-5' exonuclease [Halofilum sp. (in: g-proteobacteria)]